MRKECVKVCNRASAQIHPFFGDVFLFAHKIEGTLPTGEYLQHIHCPQTRRVSNQTVYKFTTGSLAHHH